MRPPYVAGQFYPKEKDKLKSMLKAFFTESEKEKVEVEGKLKALIVPHAGYIFSGLVAAYGYSLVPEEKQQVFILGPSHQVAFQGLAFGNENFWKTPLGEIKVDQSTVAKIAKEESFRIINEAHEYEHSIEVQLPFLQTTLGNFSIIPILTGQVEAHKNSAKVLNNYSEGDSLLVVSSDLSHYLSYDSARKKDRATIDKVLNLNSSIQHDEACGADGIKILIEMAKINHWKPKLVKYLNSGNTAGGTDQVVGYAAIIFYK